MRLGTFGLVMMLGLAATGTATPAARGRPICRRILPSATSNAIEAVYRTPREHYVCLDPEAQRKNRLLVFFPGTRAAPDRYSILMEEAARSGLHVVSLSYPNRFAVNLEVCPFFDDPECYGQIREEIIYGNGAFEPLKIDAANSIVGRLSSLLAHLDRHHPDEGWGRYLEEAGRPAWSDIVVSGHSQGGGHATMLARDQEVARCVIFAWTDRLAADYGANRASALAPWIKEPFATPPERIYSFTHVRDRGYALRKVMWEVLGMTELAPIVDVDETEPPFQNSRALVTRITPAQAQRLPSPHSAVASDDSAPLDADGVPVLREVWRYLFDVPPAKE